MTSDKIGAGRELPNGGGVAAFLAAGIGAFAVGLFVVLNETGILVAPSLYPPAGGVSGRTTLAALVWLVSWGVLHARWKDREVAAGRAFALALLLIALGLIGTFPPVWALL